jgi:TPR repeat protein
MTLLLIAGVTTACATRKRPNSTSDAAEKNAPEGAPVKATKPPKADGSFADRAITRANAGDDEGAIALMVEGCSRAEARSCSLLAERHVQGRGVARDLAKGLSLYEQACTNEHAVACQKAGSIYANGGYSDGTELGTVKGDVDLAKSFALHERACNLGLPDGCMSVGYMYEHGEHVEKDPEKAASLYKRACDNGLGDACYALGLLTLDPKTDTEQINALMVKGCEQKGAYACGEVANISPHGCCAFGALMRACEGGLQQACISAGVHIGKPILPSYLKICSTGSFDGCTYLEADIARYRSIEADEQG